jgi:hypothetical protein
MYKRARRPVTQKKKHKNGKTDNLIFLDFILLELFLLAEGRCILKAYDLSYFTKMAGRTISEKLYI